MSIRYTPDELKHLRDSPLVVKPSGLPPAEQWMGLPTDTARNATKPVSDRAKIHDSNGLLDQSRRPAVERHISRNSANPEDIVLGPPKTSFMSATSLRNAGKTFDASERPPLREGDSRDRYSFRTKASEGEGDRTREIRNNTLRPKRAEEDNEGWSTVKPRKSFGTEGAERFTGRMGLGHKDDRRYKDREEGDVKERPRGFGNFSRDKDGEHDQDRDARRNGTGRGRNESWFKDKENADAAPAPRDRNSNGDRFAERKGGWRDKERDDRRDREGRGGDREDRRWDRDRGDRDQRQEREPEWLDQPEEEKGQKHTVEDFQKWREMQQRKDNAGKTPMEDTAKPDAGASFFGLDKPKVETPLEIIEKGPDKFFGMWSANKDESGQETGAEPKNEGIPKAKTMGKASRFTSFFTPQEEPQRRQTEPPSQMPNPDLSRMLANMTNATSPQPDHPQPQGEREAFAMLLQKLHQKPGPPLVQTASQPKPPAPDTHSSNVHSPEPFQQYRTDRQDDNRLAARNSGQSIQDLLLQRQIAGSQPQIRPDQMLQELVGQRQNASSQASARANQNQTQSDRNTNTEFLMGLMQSAKAAPEPQRSEQVLLRMPPKADRQMQQQMMIEREQEMQREAALRERGASQRRPPPGFFDDPSFQRGPPPQERQGANPPQPTQILQRPPPPGMELGWDRQAQLPPQHRLAQNIAPPPGLANGLNRGMPMPQQMFPPGFPMGHFPPPDVMSGPPRNLQMQPPPGFFNAAPPGFMPGMSGFQGPEGMAFGAPFDGRGPPPQGFRRQ